MGSGLAALGRLAVTAKDKVVEMTSSDDEEEVRIKRRYFFTGIAVLAAGSFWAGYQWHAGRVAQADWRSGMSEASATRKKVSS